jgi:hypothetical protein
MSCLPCDDIVATTGQQTFDMESNDLPFFHPQKKDGGSHEPKWIRINEGAIRKSGLSKHALLFCNLPPITYIRGGHGSF